VCIKLHVYERAVYIQIQRYAERVERGGMKAGIVRRVYEADV